MMNKGRGGGEKEREAPAHLIEIQKFLMLDVLARQ